MNLTFQDVSVLIRGCSRHQPYRGTKPPSGDCEMCNTIYEARQKFNRIQDEQQIVLLYRDLTVRPAPANLPVEDLSGDIFSGEYDARCYHCGKGATHTITQHTREITASRRR